MMIFNELDFIFNEIIRWPAFLRRADLVIFSEQIASIVTYVSSLIQC